VVFCAAAVPNVGRPVSELYAKEGSLAAAKVPEVMFAALVVSVVALDARPLMSAAEG